jgi:sedoheptulokinase
MSIVVGLDLGTTTLSGVVWDGDQRAVLRQSRRRNTAAIPCASAWRAEQDPHRLRAQAMQVLAEVTAGGPPVDGIALTGQMHGLLCVDAGGEPLTPLISWQDRRTAEPLPDGSTTLEQMHARVADLDWHENGCRVAHGYGAATLHWLVQQHELPPCTRRVCSVADWLAGWLTDRLPSTDPTLAASWGVYSLAAGAWNTAFLQRWGLPQGLLPPILASGAPVGGLVPETAQRVGLPAGVPVINPLGDTQAAFLGSVEDPTHTLLFNLGTGGQVCWMVPRFERPTAAVEVRPVPGGTLRVGASLCGGAAYAWLNDTVRAWLAAFGVEVSEEGTYARLNALAQAADGSEGLSVRPTFLGSRADPALDGGTIQGITWDNLRLGALARATLVGVVDELRDLYLEHTRSTDPHTLVVASGGGVRQNPLLPRLIQERFGMPVEVCRHPEPAAAGAASLAAGALAPQSPRA